MDEFLAPYILSNLLGLALILLAIKQKNVTRGIFAFLFMGAALFNYFTVINNPQIYVTAYGEGAIPMYQEFINGPFSIYTQAIVYFIATGQMISGFLMLTKGVWFRTGVTGAIIFLLAIAPLGKGSAFPATLLMVVSLSILLYKKMNTTILDTKLIEKNTK